MTDQELIQTIIECLASADSADADWGDVVNEIIYYVKKHRKEQYEKILKRYERDIIISEVASLNQDIEHLESERKKYDSIIEYKKQELETLKTKNQMKWLPIETAPKDRKPFEMFAVIAAGIPNGIPYTTDPYYVWMESGDTFARWPYPFPPTHWHPMPTFE